MSYSFGVFRLRHDGVLIVGKALVDLTRTEEGVLRTLLEAGSVLVSKNALVESVWRDRCVSDASLNRCVHTLRRKLEAAWPGGGRLIVTGYGRGYRMAAPVGVVGAAPERLPALGRSATTPLRAVPSRRYLSRRGAPRKTKPGAELPT